MRSTTSSSLPVSKLNARVLVVFVFFHFSWRYTKYKRSFCQDRLGTNTGQTQEESGAVFSLGAFDWDKFPDFIVGE